ncbi:hypothetical protein ACFODL_18555 [Phenylobacterium terrae]|uniref:Glycosyltransferase 2-like domain-containing protein n=1 Tax=Phenylobacterium terrae TaxID=2665495 RepID=A0ABW4N1Z4_9CAUL
MPADAPSIFLATPCYGGEVTIEYMKSVMALQAACDARGIRLHVELHGGDSLIPRARGTLATRFLASGYSHLFFCDADIGFAPEAVFRLLDAGKDLIGGIYPLKRTEWEKVRKAALAGAADLQTASLGFVVRFIPNARNEVEVEDGLARVAYVGTGFMMVARQVVERLAAAHPELKVRMGDMSSAEETHMLFETMVEPETREYLSEDYAFCRRWRDLGGEVWADLSPVLVHVGRASYAGSLLSALGGTP